MRLKFKDVSSSYVNLQRGDKIKQHVYESKMVGEDVCE